MRMTRQTVAVVLLAACCSAQERSKPPEGGAPKPFRIPARQTWKLPNGLQANMVPFGQVPVVSIQAVMLTGNAYENAAEVGMADLTVDMMKEGAGKRNAEELAEAAASMGGAIGTSVDQDQSTVSITVLSEFAPQAVALIADILRKPMLPASEFPRLRADVERRFAVYRSNPQAIADEQFAQTLYGDHPYGRPLPDDDHIKKYTLEQVQKFYASQFGAGRTRVYVAGVFDAASTRKSIDAAFGDWAKGGEAVVPAPKLSTTRTLKTSNRPNAPQSTIRIGLAAPSPSEKDYVPMYVTNHLLGGSFVSRITTNIREQKGFTYSPYSNVSAHPKSAHWVHSSDVTQASTGAAMKEIFKEIETVRKKAPSAEELNGIQQNVAGGFVLRNSNPGGIIRQLSFVDLHGLGDAWLNNYVQNVMAVKPAEIQAMSEKYLNPDKMTIVVVGDESKVKEQVAPFAKSTP